MRFEISMSRVIEPSEIIINQESSFREATLKANPWLRFIARFFDYSLFFAILHWALPPFPWPFFEKFIPIEFLAFVPVEALLLSTWGTTPGRWLLKTDLRFGHARR